MAEFYVRNSLNMNKAVKFNITLRYFVIKGVKGEHVWTLEIGTTYPDTNGDSISPKRVHNISTDNFDGVIENALADLCNQVDWSPLAVDRWAPYVLECSPADGETDVDLHSNVNVTLRDDFPAAGIDLSNIKITLNNSMVDFDITNEIETEGDPREYSFIWRPPMRVYDTYD